MSIVINKLDLLKQIAIPPVLVRAPDGFCGLEKQDDILGMRYKLWLSGAIEGFIPVVVNPPASGSYKSIKWKAKILQHEEPTNTGTKTSIYIIGMEDAPGFLNAIALVQRKEGGSTYLEFKASVNGSFTTANVSNVDTSQMHEYEIRWYSDKAELYVDGQLVASVNASPSVPMIPFVELLNTDSEKHHLELFAFAPFPDSAIDILKSNNII